MARNENGEPSIRVHIGAWFAHFVSEAAAHDNFTALAGGCPRR